LRWLAAGALALLAAGGCTSGSPAARSATPAGTTVTVTAPSSATTGAGPGGPAPSTAAGPTSAPRADEVLVTLSGDRLVLSRSTVPPGTWTFVAGSADTATSGLAIKGPGIQVSGRGSGGAGGGVRLTVSLRSGRYELWAPAGASSQARARITLQVRG
jgi:hypothetical protein